MATILITGGTGNTGMALSRLLLSANHKVIILSRSLHKGENIQGIQYALWNVSENFIDIGSLQEADAIVHLAGSPVIEKRWTTAYKKEIVDSRVRSLEFIIDTLATIPNKVRLLLSASAIGWYGPGDNNKIFKEDDPYQKDFLGTTCAAWEAAADKATSLGIRVAKLRTGIVLSKTEGAYPEFKKSLQFGIASILGSGNQVVSWIDMEDLCRMYKHILDNTHLSGVFNAVAPEPVSNKQLTITIAKQLKNKFYIPVYVPSFILRVIFGERSIEILKSATVSCAKIRESGFTFLYPSIEASIRHLESKISSEDTPPA